ncbi:hypothetical protein TWF730_001281 [Orbilia blumenaviensis]|uniref:Uncharacterized protein n=1 Tax=Orbilia blumenaviensis TaxID=1796055 RepID=A0AAV9UKU6_9PEZI
MTPASSHRMSTFRISIAASRPVPTHHLRPNLRRSLVFFVHHRSGSQQCHIPPSSPNRSWAQSLAQLVHSTRNSNANHIPKAKCHPLEKSKAIQYHWAQSHAALIKDWLNVPSANRHHSPDRIRHDSWRYNARDATQRIELIRKSVFRSLGIMSKPYVRRDVRLGRPTTVKGSQTSASTKPKTNTATASFSKSLPFRKRFESEVSDSSKLGSPSLLDKTLAPAGNLEPPLNPRVNVSTESEELPTQIDAKVPGVDGIQVPIATYNTGPIDSQNDSVIIGAPNAITNEGPKWQTVEGHKFSQIETTNVEAVAEPNDMGKASKLSPADLIASLRYYDRRRGALPDEEPLSAEDIAALESSRTKSNMDKKPISQSGNSTDSSTRKSSFKRVGLAVSSVVVGAYVFGVGTKLFSVKPESTAATELLSAVQRSKASKGLID